MIIHIDCNSFYASCEIAFRPDLQGKPVVVANYNEAGGGIILALTKEAKNLGLKRGDPVFKVNDVLNKNNVAVFPANLIKYVDISRRLMQVVKDQGVVLDFKQYSVDEFFGELPLSDPKELRDCAMTVKQHIERCVGVPVSCGISQSYTLAKIATWYSKHYEGYEGVCVLPEVSREKALRNFKINDVWGIGRRTSPQLIGKGIDTALKFYQMSEYDVRKILHINGVRTWKELHGIPSIDISSPAKQQSIMHSRTFTYMTSDLDTLRSYISNYAVGASRKLRDQHSVCTSVTTFIYTNPHREDLQQYGNSATVRLNIATADTMTIAKAAIKALEQIFKKGYQYKRAGVLLSGIMHDDAVQMDLFDSDADNMKKSKRLMAVLDSLNTKYGMDSVRLANQHIKEENVDLSNIQPSTNPTTNINDIITVK